jgi:hypothetical protein
MKRQDSAKRTLQKDRTMPTRSTEDAMVQVEIITALVESQNAIIDQLSDAGKFLTMQVLHTPLKKRRPGHCPS